MATPWWAGQASLEGCPFFESASHKWCYFSDSQDSRVQESEVVMGTAWLTIMPGDPLEKFLLSVPINSCSAGLQFQKEKCFYQETQR